MEELLQLACQRDNIKAVTLLLDMDKDVNKDMSLIDASERGYTDIVKLLLDHGADPNKGGVFHDTALHLASTMGHKDIVELLLKHMLKHCIDPSLVLIWLKKEWLVNNVN